MKAREQAFTAGIILKAWKKLGICPLNSKIFTDKDYTPSTLASKELYLPEEFLTEPSSDMPIPDDALSEHKADLSNDNLGNEDDSWHDTEMMLVADQSADTQLEGDVEVVIDAESELAESDDDIDLEGNTGGDGGDSQDDDGTHYLITSESDMGTHTQVSSTSAMLSMHALPSNGTPGDCTPACPVNRMTAPTPLPATPAVNSAESTTPSTPDAQSQNVTGDGITRPNR